MIEQFISQNPSVQSKLSDENKNIQLLNRPNYTMKVVSDIQMTYERVTNNFKQALSSLISNQYNLENEGKNRQIHILPAQSDPRSGEQIYVIFDQKGLSHQRLKNIIKKTKQEKSNVQQLPTANMYRIPPMQFIQQMHMNPYHPQVYGHTSHYLPQISQSYDIYNQLNHQRMMTNSQVGNSFANNWSTDSGLFRKQSQTSEKPEGMVFKSMDSMKYGSKQNNPVPVQNIDIKMGNRQINVQIGSVTQQKELVNSMEMNIERQEKLVSENDFSYPGEQSIKKVQCKDEQSDSFKMNKKQRPVKLNDTKNITKNFSKAIISYIVQNKDLGMKILNQDSSCYEEFITMLKQRKNKMTNIKQLRDLWTNDLKDEKQIEFNRAFRVISKYFIQNQSIGYVYNSRISNAGWHLKYRYNLLRALKDPNNFKFIKDT